MTKITPKVVDINIPETEGKVGINMVLLRRSLKEIRDVFVNQKKDIENKPVENMRAYVEGCAHSFAEKLSVIEKAYGIEGKIAWFIAKSENKLDLTYEEEQTITQLLEEMGEPLIKAIDPSLPYLKKGSNLLNLKNGLMILDFEFLDDFDKDQVMACVNTFIDVMNEDKDLIDKEAFHAGREDEFTDKYNLVSEWYGAKVSGISNRFLTDYLQRNGFSKLGSAEMIPMAFSKSQHISEKPRESKPTKPSRGPVGEFIQEMYLFMPVVHKCVDENRRLSRLPGVYDGYNAPFVEGDTEYLQEVINIAKESTSFYFKDSSELVEEGMGFSTSTMKNEDIQIELPFNKVYLELSEYRYISRYSTEFPPALIKPVILLYRCSDTSIRGYYSLKVGDNLGFGPHIIMRHVPSSESHYTFPVSFEIRTSGGTEQEVLSVHLGKDTIERYYSPSNMHNPPEKGVIGTEHCDWLVETILRVSISSLEELYNPDVQYVFKPSSEKINRKRRKRGKLEQRDYHTITVSSEGCFRRCEGEGSSSHILRRSHRRRGHWCTSQKTGKRWWRKDTVVGAAIHQLPFKEYVVKND